MVRKVLAAVTMTAIAALFVGGGSASASSGVHKQVRYVRLAATNGFYVDNDPSGPSGGDLFGSTGDLTHNSGKVGTFSSACTTTSAGGGQCNASFIWNSGDRLQLAGQIDMQEVKNHLSIVGDTGKYKKARGQASLTRLDDQGAVQRVKLTILR
ncbi:MAG: hypothetical protein ACRDK1_01400 [Solirubrobacterales bacterium]